MKRHAFLLFALLATAGAPLVAQITNGSFDSDVTGWHLVGRGTIAHTGADGGAAPGALELTGGLAGNRTQLIAGQCVTVTGGTLTHWNTALKVVSGNQDFCRLALFESPRADCLGLTLGAELTRSGHNPTWATSRRSFTTAANTKAVELRLHCATSGGDLSPLVVRFDDVTQDAPPTQSPADALFDDGFETGNTGAWDLSDP